MFKKLAAFALAFGVSTAPTAAYAADCSSADLGISSTYFVACFNNFANSDPSPAVLAFLNGTSPYSNGATWTYDAANKSDNAGTFGIFTSNPGTSSGTLTFDPTKGASGWFGIGLKAGNGMNVYVYNSGDVVINSFSFSTATVGQEGLQGLSHAAFYDGLDGGGPDCSTVGTCSVVPEPSTYALMATGLLGIFGFARRRRNNA